MWTQLELTTKKHTFTFLNTLLKNHAQSCRTPIIQDLHADYKQSFPLAALYVHNLRNMFKSSFLLIYIFGFCFYLLLFKCSSRSHSWFSMLLYRINSNNSNNSYKVSLFMLIINSKISTCNSNLMLVMVTLAKLYLQHNWMIASQEAILMVILSKF